MDIEPRPLSDVELAVANLLLSGQFDGVGPLRQQVAGAKVVGRCDCGCPTIYLLPDPSAPSAPVAGPLAPAELRVMPVGEGPPGEVLLFIEAGRVASLEYVFYDDGTPPSRWPDLDRMTVVPR